MARRTKEDALATRNLLLDTAEKVFSERGVSHATLNDIAEAAGLTRGAIYWHFKNKADLLDAMLERVTLPMEEMLGMAADEQRENPLASIRACALNVLKRTATDPQTKRVFEIICHKCEYADDMAPVRERHIENRDACLQEVERGMRNAIRKGQLPKTVNPRIAAIGMHALIDGLIANWVLDTEYFPLAQYAEKMVDTYLAGLQHADTASASAQSAGAPSGKNAKRPGARTTA